MNEKCLLGPYITDEDLGKLPKLKIEKYRREKLEARINKGQAKLFDLFSGGNENYFDILQRFNETASESEEMKMLLLENKKIVEIMEVVLNVLASGRCPFESWMTEINKGIEIVFVSDFGQHPWKEKLLSSISDNVIIADEIDSLASFLKKLNISDEEIKSALAKALSNTETKDRGFSVEILRARKKYGIEIEPGRIDNLKVISDQSLKHLVFARAVESYEVLTEIGCDIGPERNNIVSIYRSDREDSQKKELIKNIGIGLGIISKPKEPEKIDEKEEKNKDAGKSDPWWKFWQK